MDCSNGPNGIGCGFCNSLAALRTSSLPDSTEDIITSPDSAEGNIIVPPDSENMVIPSSDSTEDVTAPLLVSGKDINHLISVS
ncbi:uncharacterized [Tachysurus ichikawai]